MYQMKKLEIEYKNFLDNKIPNNTLPYLVKEHNRLNQDVEIFNHYDITELIDTYIDMLKKSCELYKIDKEKVIFTDPPKFKNYMESEMGKDIIMRNDAWLQTFFDITDDDIVNYDNGTFTDLLINELKKCLEYEEIDGKIKWEINSIEEKTIELPYNCYLEYIPYKRIKNENINMCKKVLEVKIKNPEEFDNNKSIVYFDIKYENLNGITNYVEGGITKHIIDNKEYYGYHTVFWPIEDKAYATLKSHTGDRRRYEADLIAARDQIWLEEEEEKYKNGYKMTPEEEKAILEQQIRLRESLFGNRKP